MTRLCVVLRALHDQIEGDKFVQTQNSFSFWSVRITTAIMTDTANSDDWRPEGVKKAEFIVR